MHSLYALLRITNYKLEMFKICECQLIFFLVFSNFYQVDIDDETCVALANMR